MFVLRKKNSIWIHQTSQALCLNKKTARTVIVQTCIKQLTCTKLAKSQKSSLHYHLDCVIFFFSESKPNLSLNSQSWFEKLCSADVALVGLIHVFRAGPLFPLILSCWNFPLVPYDGIEWCHRRRLCFVLGVCVCIDVFIFTWHCPWVRPVVFSNNTYRLHLSNRLYKHWQWLHVHQSDMSDYCAINPD